MHDERTAQLVRDLTDLRAQAVAELVADARRATAPTTPPRPCVYCGSPTNIRCCEFGRDR
jgi:hypothetical protein